MSDKPNIRRKNVLRGQSKSELRNYILQDKKHKKSKKKRKNGNKSGQTVKSKLTSESDSKSTKLSHKGRKRIKILGSCEPSKKGECLKPTFLPSNSYESRLLCDHQNDYCLDDCDCPGYQKCCHNSCGRMECLVAVVRDMSVLETTTTTVTPSAHTNNKVMVEKNEEPSTEKPASAEFPHTVYRAWV